MVASRSWEAETVENLSPRGMCYGSGFRFGGFFFFFLIPCGGESTFRRFSFQKFIVLSI